MRYTRFEDLPVWKSAIELAMQVYELTSKPQFKSRYSLRDQIERAAVSVSNNIAEGFERGTNNNREAVKQHSPGLPRCVATLGLIGSKGAQPRWGCDTFSLANTQRSR